MNHAPSTRDAEASSATGEHRALAAPDTTDDASPSQTMPHLPDITREVVPKPGESKGYDPYNSGSFVAEDLKPKPGK